jgi:hypothetical protein
MTDSSAHDDTVEHTKQEWRIEIGRLGQHCKVLLNGEPIYPCAADLHLEVGRPSTLSLKFPTYGSYRGMLADEPTFRRGDVVMAEGTPLRTYFEVDGRRFRVIEELPPGDLENGLFGVR